MKINQPLIISLLLHICLYLLFLQWPGNKTGESRQQDIEIVYQSESEEKKTRQIVTTPEQDLKEALSNLRKKAERLSAQTQRVKEETKAPNGNRTHNSSPAVQTKNDHFRRNKIPTYSLDPHAPVNSVGRDTKLGYSTLSDHIPEVKSGGFTALNSDQFVFYTFYARTNEQIRNRWVQNIRQFINQSMQTEISRLSQRPQISQIEILLTADGHFVRAILHQQSENQGLEEAAIAAFRLAAPFNNPPAEMIQSDGYIHLYYSFHVHFNPRYLAKGSGTR